MNADRLAALRAGLVFCSKDHRPVIEAMIAEIITGEANKGGIETAAQEPQLAGIT